MVSTREFQAITTEQPTRRGVGVRISKQGSSWIVLALSLFSTLASAEEVVVRYRGPVSLDGFRCVVPESSFVRRICYLAHREYVVVLLGGTYYHYCRVPADVVSDWFTAESKGRFYNAEVKGGFDCRLGGVPYN